MRHSCSDPCDSRKHVVKLAVAEATVSLEITVGHSGVIW